MKKLVILLSIIFINIGVLAHPYYINDNGVEMNETQYNKMVSMYSHEYVQKMMSQEKFDQVKDVNIISSDVLYERIDSLNGQIISRTYLTDEEYNSLDTMPDLLDYREYETSYKKLTTSIYQAPNGQFVLDCDLNWKRVPSTKSFDVFAFLLNRFSYSNVVGSQVYYANSGNGQFNYNSSSPGYKGLSEGAGISMDLKDGYDITGYDMMLTALLNVNQTGFLTGNVYVTYQHAQMALTRADSMSYTLSTGGLGGVLNYSNSTTRNKYDGMTGLAFYVSIS